MSRALPRLDAATGATVTTDRLLPSDPDSVSLGSDLTTLDASVNSAMAPALDDLVARLREAAAAGDTDVSPRALLEEAGRRIDAAFEPELDVQPLLRARSQFMDALVLQLWRQEVGEPGEVALVAVGGYGRGELHPFSDVDLMVLLHEDDKDCLEPAIEPFLRALWDLGLELGHSVRSPADCEESARGDITIATSLMEARLIGGSVALFEDLRAALAPDRLLPGADFFKAKLAEQRERHARFHDTAYNLEPNIKDGPGGLRDIQVINWVARRHYRTRYFDDLVRAGFLTASECQDLKAGQRYLWQVRYALHLAAGRREDRLLFDQQRTLATRFGYQDQRADNLAVEQFMQRFYRNVQRLERLNELLLQLYSEDILSPPDDEPEIINSRFQARRGYLEVRHDGVFQDQPAALLEMFVVLQANPHLRGVRAATIRLVRQHLNLIDEHLRGDPAARDHFMNLLRGRRGIFTNLTRMIRYGVLARYMPVFGNIVGRMQYDLFHAYTVDQHTLFVVRNMRRFGDEDRREEFPLASSIYARIAKPELLYLSGIFHDIAKGRGGDHSELGAEDAEDFCHAHGLSGQESHLVSWLVRNHLLMSATAQRKDISDPRVVHDFALQVGDIDHLNYLYLLTVADICATSPKLWNSWRDQLLMDLYRATRYALRRGLENPIDREELVSETRVAALDRLLSDGLTRDEVEALWVDFPEECFWRYNADQIAWQTQAIRSAETDESGLPMVAVRHQAGRGSTEIFLYTDGYDGLFAEAAAALDSMLLNVVEARIINSHNGKSLDVFRVLGVDGKPLSSRRAAEIAEVLPQRLSEGRRGRTGRRRMSRRMRHFDSPVEVRVSPHDIDRRTLVEVVCLDKPGILAAIGAALRDCRLRVHDAKIATFGERVEDFFAVTDEKDEPITDAQHIDAIKQAIRTRAESLDSG